MFFRDKVHVHEVIKWGIIAGVLEGLFIGLAAIIYQNVDNITALAYGLEYAAGIILILLLSLSAIVTTIIVFAHPIHSLLKRNYKDALLTVVVTIITVLVFSAVVFTIIVG